MPALVSPALMEEHATFSTDSKTISGITEIVDNCLTVFQYGLEVFLYEAKDFRKVRISLLLTIVPLNPQPNKGKTPPCVCKSEPKGIKHFKRMLDTCSY